MLTHTERGNGPHPILMLHGFLGSGRNLGALTRRWSNVDPSLRFVQPDLPGHGKSPPLPPGATLNTMAKDVLHFLDALELQDPLDVVGHSMGARVALALRDIAPERIRTLVLLDMTPGPTRRLRGTEKIVEALLSAPAEADNRAVMAEHLGQEGVSKAMVDWLLMNLEAVDTRVRWRIDRTALADFGARSSHEDLWAIAEGDPETTYCLYGANSDYVSLADRTRMAHSGIAIEAVPDAGHFVHADAPEAVTEALRTWRTRDIPTE